MNIMILEWNYDLLADKYFESYKDDLLFWKEVALVNTGVDVVEVYNYQA